MILDHLIPLLKETWEFFVLVSFVDGPTEIVLIIIAPTNDQVKMSTFQKRGL
jgi:hypothetical protein